MPYAVGYGYEVGSAFRAGLFCSTWSIVLPRLIREAGQDLELAVAADFQVNVGKPSREPNVIGFSGSWGVPF